MSDVSLTTIKNSPPNEMPDSLDGNVLTISNGDLGNTNTSYFYFDLVKVGLNIFSLQFTIQATTLTLEGTNDEPSISNASATWTDITNLFIDPSGTPITSITATGSLTARLPLIWSRLRIKRLTTNATNALTLILTRGRVR